MFNPATFRLQFDRAATFTDRGRAAVAETRRSRTSSSSGTTSIDCANPCCSIAVCVVQRR